MSDAGDELVDLVDADDRVVATVPRREMRASPLWHRCVYLLVQRADGAVLLHRRSLAKDFAPGAWDIGAGGVVAAGEAYDEAARRELAEELGVMGVPLEPLGPVRYHDERLRVIGRAYRVRSDGPFSFDDGEVLETEWVPVAALPGVLAAREFVPDSPQVFLPFLGPSLPPSP